MRGDRPGTDCDEIVEGRPSDGANSLPTEQCGNVTATTAPATNRLGSNVVSLSAVADGAIAYAFPLMALGAISRRVADLVNYVLHGTC
jgi:hypothetical protein